MWNERIGDLFTDFGLRMQGRDPQEQRMKLKHMQSLLESEEGQRLLRQSQIAINEARARSLDRGEGYYGGRRSFVDPYIKGAEDLGKIRAARDKFTEEELTPEAAAYFDAAEKSVLDRMKSEKADKLGFRQTELGLGAGISPNIPARDFVVPTAPTGKRKRTGEMETSKSAAEYFQPVERDLRLEGQLQASPDKGIFDRLGEFFQAPTETVPESNIPKTYPQLGITNVDDMATLQEMQEALPEVDMREEFEADPELMKKLIELWKAKKLTKKNLHKAFSMIHQTAQQALGIA